MLSVHGIAVSGPTFPAQIWRLFMEHAVKYAPLPKEFPVAEARRRSGSRTRCSTR